MTLGQGDCNKRSARRHNSVSKYGELFHNPLKWFRDVLGIRLMTDRQLEQKQCLTYINKYWIRIIKLKHVFLLLQHCAHGITALKLGPR